MPRQPELDAYHHTQKAHWWLLLYAIGAAFIAVSWSMPVMALRITFFVTGLFIFLLGMSFFHLTVADQGDQLAVRFGPFPLFRKRLRYDDIVGVEKGRTTLLDGWGVHWNPWSGWVYNIWGFDCVVVRLKKGKVKVGTDDPDGLLEFLQGRAE